MKQLTDEEWDERKKQVWKCQTKSAKMLRMSWKTSWFWKTSLHSLCNTDMLVHCQVYRKSYSTIMASSRKIMVYHNLVNEQIYFKMPLSFFFSLHDAFDWLDENTFILWPRSNNPCSTCNLVTIHLIPAIMCCTLCTFVFLTVSSLAFHLPKNDPVPYILWSGRRWRRVATSGNYMW